jgi:hypothetical protein
LRTNSEAKAGDPKIEAEGYCRIRYSLKRPPHIRLDGRVLRLSLLERLEHLLGINNENKRKILKTTLVKKSRTPLPTKSVTLAKKKMLVCCNGNQIYGIIYLAGLS